MKNKILKTVTSTFIISAVFIGGVYAGSTLEQISAYLNKGVTLTWNGEVFYPQDEDGTRVYPITYNGRTYLPVKFVAEKAGLNVEWDGDTATVSLSDENYIGATTKSSSYTKLGEGEIAFLTSDFKAVAEKGFIVEEKMATTAYDAHTIKMTWASGNTLEKGQMHKLFFQEMKGAVLSSGWTLISSTPLSDGHYKNIYEHSELPLRIENYSNDTEVMFIATRTDILEKGTYQKNGNGKISFMTDDFKAFTENGYHVEETLAVSNSDKHIIKLSSMSEDILLRRKIHIADVQNNKKELLALGVELVSSQELFDGHYKNVYRYPNQPLIIEVSSSDEAVMFVAYRSDMNVTSQTLPLSSTYEGYFASVPKPNLDSKWTEETTIELTDRTVGSNVAYTLSKTFSTADPSNVSYEFEEYKNILVNNEFALYDVSSNHYTYTKGDISITIFAGYDNIYVDLASGYQAKHM